MNTCTWCKGKMPQGSRQGTKTCSGACRKSLSRHGKRLAMLKEIVTPIEDEEAKTELLDIMLYSNINEAEASRLVALFLN